MHLITGPDLTEQFWQSLPPDSAEPSSAFAGDCDFFLVPGAEDVYRFAGNESYVDYFRLVLREGNSLLIGGR